MTASPCWPRDTLKDYLNGTADDLRLSAIETHLAECQACEQTLLELERDPDTLLEAVRQQVNANDESQAKNAVDQPSSIVQRAVDAVKELGGAATAPAFTLEESSQIRLQQIGAYELLRPLGRGGMGLVMLARHATLKKQVAIKILPSLFGDRPELVRRFQREIITAGGLNHPAIVHATDAGAEQGTHYLVMEYIDGLDLSRIARLNGPLKIADACELIRQTALGLSYAHAQGVVHRDIKPSNLMLDATGRVKILDFGLAQLNLWEEAAVELTTVGQLMGTLDYMAPEQAERAGPVDYRADLYALGATLFRLLTGRAPLAVTPHMTLLEKVRMLGSQTAPQVSTLREDCPMPLVQLVEQLLKREPAQRPAGAAQVAEALQPLCMGHDLVTLLGRCRQRAASEPNAEAIAPVQRATTAPPAAPPPRRNWLALACLVPIVILAGIFLMLETQKGQLVIESEVAGIKVNVLRGDKVYQQLEIHTGARATRLFADKYAIEIEGASDAIAIDQSNVEIRRGQTIIARIMQKPDTGNADPRAVQDQPPQATSNVVEASTSKPEPIFGGRTLTQWLHVLELDMDTQTRNSTIQPILQLAKGADAATRERIHRALVVAITSEAQKAYAVVTQKDRIRYERPPRELVQALVTLYGYEGQFQVLSQEIFVDRQGKVTDATFKILLDSEQPATKLAKLTSNWLMQGNRFEQLKEYQARNALTLIENTLGDCDSKFIGALPKRILEHPQLGLKALLTLRPASQLPVRADLTALEETIAHAARDAFLSKDSTPEIVALSAARLAMTTSTIGNFRAELIARLDVRLKDLANDRPRLLDGFHVGYEGVRAGNSDKLFAAIELSPAPNQSSYIGSEIICMLTLAQRLNAIAELDAALSAIAIKTTEVGLPLAIAIKELPPLVKVDNKVSWPFDPDQIANCPDSVASFPLEAWRAVKIAANLSNSVSQPQLYSTQLFELMRGYDADIVLAVLDKDGDGQLSRVESDSSFQFDYDQNDDKLISKAEIVSWHVRGAQSQFVEDIFKLDTHLPREALTKKEAVPPLSEADFDAMDADGDQKVSVAECANYRLRHPELLAKPKLDAPVLPDTPALQWARAQIAKYDKNKDQVLTEDEWSSMLVRPAEGADADGDGRITAEEYSNSRNKNRGSRP